MKREEGETEFFNCSSAGAGSGEFHLYRQMRRKEANRQARLEMRPPRTAVRRMDFRLQ